MTRALGLVVVALLALSGPARGLDPSQDAVEQARAAPRRVGVAKLIALLREGQADAVTDRALALLAEIGAREGREVLILYTHHRRTQARALAYRALGRTNDPALGVVVARGLRDGAAEVRAASAHALSDLGAKQATSVLLQALASGVAEAAPAIGRLGDLTSLAAFDEQLGKVPLSVMLSGYEAFLAREDLGDAAKLRIVARLEEVGGAVTHDFMVQLARRPEAKLSPVVRQALAASAARIAPRGTTTPAKALDDGTVRP